MLGLILEIVAVVGALTISLGQHQEQLEVAKPVAQPELTVTVSDGTQVTPLQGSFYRPQ